MTVEELFRAMVETGLGEAGFAERDTSDLRIFLRKALARFIEEASGIDVSDAIALLEEMAEDDL